MALDNRTSTRGRSRLGISPIIAGRHPRGARWNRRALKSDAPACRSRRAPRAAGVARSTMIVMAATLASTLLGFGREVLNARYFGTRWEMDAFLRPRRVPTILFGVFNGALVSALCRSSDYLATDREEEAWQLASTLLCAGDRARVRCGDRRRARADLRAADRAGFPVTADGRRDRMTRWLMPCIIATLVSAVSSRRSLNAYHRFGRRRAARRIAINIVTIVSVVLAVPPHGHLRARARNLRWG